MSFIAGYGNTLKCINNCSQQPTHEINEPANTIIKSLQNYGSIMNIIKNNLR